MLQHKNETLEENEKIIIYFLVKNESDEKYGNKHNKYRIISEPLETTFKKNFEFEFDDKNKIVFNRFLDNLTENMFIILNKKTNETYYENFYLNSNLFKMLNNKEIFIKQNNILFKTLEVAIFKKSNYDNILNNKNKIKLELDNVVEKQHIKNDLLKYIEFCTKERSNGNLSEYASVTHTLLNNKFYDICKILNLIENRCGIKYYENMLYKPILLKNVSNEEIDNMINTVFFKTYFNISNIKKLKQKEF